MAQLVKQFASGIYNLILGLFTTSKHLGRHAVTIQYPKERWEVPERSRGMVVLLTDHETGQLNCTACLLCMRACPTAAIDIEIEKDEKGKRHLKEFKVDYNICCFCGLCEDSCNFAAIKMATKYEFPTFDKSDLTWDVKKLAEMGFDVPYEKPVRKKPAAKTDAAKPAAGPTAPKPVEKKEAGPAAEPAAETKPAEEAQAPESKPADKSAADSGDTESKEDTTS
jgi:NADH-quinone oxidoreductase subunit I